MFTSGSKVKVASRDPFAAVLLARKLLASAFTPCLPPQTSILGDHPRDRNECIYAGPEKNLSASFADVYSILSRASRRRFFSRAVRVSIEITILLRGNTDRKTVFCGCLLCHGSLEIINAETNLMFAERREFSIDAKSD